MDYQTEDLVRQPTFIFRGTVKKLNATTMETILVTPETAIVTVDKVLQVPTILGDQTGKDITIQLKLPQQLHEGQQATFYTTGWIYGTGLAVREVGHVEGASEYPGDLSATRRLQQRIAEADLIIVGTVSSIKTVERTPEQPITFHDPHWKEASIDVDSVEKGSLAEKRIVAMFPASRDIMWHNAPKFKEGQKGVFIFNKTLIQDLNAEHYTALNIEDYQLPERDEQVRSLIQAGQ